MSVPTTWSDLRKDIVRRMDSAVEVLKKDFSGLRSGRASTNLLDPVVVEAYGQTMPLSQCGTVGVPEPRMLTVQVWDKGQVKAVEKAIANAGLGLNPQADGQLIRVPIPPLNEERRKELQKVAGKYAEAARISVRNVRRDGMDSLKKMEKDGHLSEDEIKKHEKEVQSVTDETIKKIDDLLTSKEKEIIQV
ncbi:ribosome recycling factor [Magnetospirillum fulvum]|uniref:Ribosome-recycling factor n=1 Tax=Magnetospirillum fulvum TaxID=1082 RepID=A0A1H6GMM0_MAGFU|nr:ribosome recycling factor [Magnetospirillum fulvum]SEH24551.1 ribosome recycling factor [Magnetospirillum fulvum]